MKKNLFFTIFCLLMVFTISLKAGAYTISGYIQYASQVVVTLSGNASMVTVTDGDGYYEFTGLEAGGMYTITPSKGYTPPRVQITNPPGNSSVTGRVEIAADVKTDYCGYAFNPHDITIDSLDSDMENQDFQVMVTSCCFVITNVDFFINGSLQYSYPASEMCQATYTYPWDTTAFSNGMHSIKVSVVDDNSGTGSAEIQVTVQNGITGMPLVGDVNKDGSVDIIDALSVARYFVELVPPVFDAPAGDVNLDDQVDILDALLIAQYYVGLITTLPEKKPGGYSQISNSSENALAAYDFLETELETSQPDITLEGIKFAFSQAVSGMNVRLVCTYHSSATGKDHYLSAVIFFNLDMIPEDVVSLNLDIY